LQALNAHPQQVLDPGLHDGILLMERAEREGGALQAKKSGLFGFSGFFSLSGSSLYSSRPTKQTK
jgi:hypothetical protein